MPAKPEHEKYWDRKRQNSELLSIEKIMREEGVYTKAGEATTLRPKTANALVELSLCYDLEDFKRLTQTARGWENMLA